MALWKKRTRGGASLRGPERTAVTPDEGWGKREKGGGKRGAFLMHRNSHIKKTSLGRGIGLKRGEPKENRY